MKYRRLEGIRLKRIVGDNTEFSIADLTIIALSPRFDPALFVGKQGWLVHNAGVMDCLGNAAKALGWDAGNSDTLRANLKAAGLVPPGAPNAAHHIVPHSDLCALPSIEVMVKYGIHSDDAVNGVFLRYVDNIGEGANHRYIHTDSYYRELNRRITGVSSGEELILELRNIANELRLDVFPYK